MSDNPRITLDLKEYLQGMEARLLEDSKHRQENCERVTKANFDKLVEVSKADREAMKSHADSTRWVLISFIAIVCLAIVYVETNDRNKVVQHTPQVELSDVTTADRNVPQP